MSVLELTDEDFGAVVAQSQVPVLVDVWAQWCAPCRKMAPIIDQIAVEYSGRLAVVKVEADLSPNTVAALGITSIPSLLLFANGEVVKTVTGSKTRQEIIDLVLKETIR